MRFLDVSVGTVVGLSLGLGSNAAPRNLVDPKPPSCADIGEDDAKWAKKIWTETEAGVIADEWINKHGVSNWVHDLNQHIFDHGPSDSWDCFGSDSSCDLEAECEDYAEVAEEGHYYLYYSIQAARKFFDNLRSRFMEKTINEILDVSQIIEDFKEHDDGDDPNPLIILSACLGMAGGAMASSAFRAGAAGAASGLSSLMANTEPKEGEGEDFGARMDAKVQEAFKTATSQIEKITGALFGKEGYDQDLIPDEMISGEGNENRVVGVFGDGQWLVQHPTTLMDSVMEDMYHRMRQGLAWTMIRHARKSFWWIDSGTGEEECGDGDGDSAEEFYDGHMGGCIKLKSAPGAEMRDLPQEIHDKLWGGDGDYDLDRREVFRNAYDCWVDNDGEVGEPASGDSLEEYPSCFFGIPVVKGEDDTDYFIYLDEFPGQTEGEKWSVKL